MTKAADVAWEKVKWAMEKRDVPADGDPVRPYCYTMLGCRVRGAVRAP